MINSNNKVAVYLATRNYYIHLLPAVTSLIVNSSVDVVYLLIEDDEFPYKLPDNVITLNASHQDWFAPTSPNYNCGWSYMVLLKVVLPFIFPLKDKILYLDVDTIVDQNIDDIWDIDISDYYFGAAKELHKSTSDYSYFNAGVLLMNLDKLRNDNMAGRIIDKLNTKSYGFAEQDCINELCQGQILEIPSDYNVTAFNAIPNERRIIHFAAIRNWYETALYKKYMNIYRTYIWICTTNNIPIV